MMINTLEGLTHTLSRSTRPCLTAEGGAAVLGLSSAQRYCPKVLLGGAVPVLAAASASKADLFAFEGLLGVL